MTDNVESATSSAIPMRLSPMQVFSLGTVRAAGRKGLTAIEAARLTSSDRYVLQPRFSELRRKGLIIDSGQRRLNPSGRPAIIWLAREYHEAGDEACWT